MLLRKQWFAAVLLIFLPDQFLCKDVLGNGFWRAALIRLGLVGLARTTWLKLDCLGLGLRAIFLELWFCILLTAFLCNLLKVFARISGLSFRQVGFVSRLGARNGLINYIFDGG